MKLEQLAREARGANIRIRIRRRKFLIEIGDKRMPIVHAASTDLEAATRDAVTQLRRAAP